MIRVVVCDDQEVVREGRRAIVGTAPGMQVVGVAGDGAEVVDVVEGTRPDVVLMDLNMPIVTGVEATRELHEKFPTVKVLVLTTFDADEWFFDAIRAGASGYLLKDAPRADLLAAIAGTAAGKTFVD
jgi:DNA-binding NarL/FixJ family response regulator